MTQPLSFAQGAFLNSEKILKRFDMYMNISLVDYYKDRA